MCIRDRNGTALVQTVVSIFTVTSEASATFKFVVESQPADPVVVNVYVPAPVTFCPFQVNGTALVQTVVSMFTVTSEASATFKLVVESQPADPVSYTHLRA